MRNQMTVKLETNQDSLQGIKGACAVKFSDHNWSYNNKFDSITERSGG